MWDEYPTRAANAADGSDISQRSPAWMCTFERRINRAAHVEYKSRTFMRSWSVLVGRLFGVEVRMHLTFFLLPVFVFWTEYGAHNGSANGPRDMALVGIILACVAAHET